MTNDETSSFLLTVSGIRDATDIYNLHKTFCKLESGSLQRQIDEIDRELFDHLKIHGNANLEWPSSDYFVVVFLNCILKIVPPPKI